MKIDGVISSAQLVWQQEIPAILIQPDADTKTLIDLIHVSNSIAHPVWLLISQILTFTKVLLDSRILALRLIKE